MKKTTQITVPSEHSPQWEFVLDQEGRRTNVRCLRGTTIIEVFYKGEKILVDVAALQTIDISPEKV